jgi:pyruvate,water dikinase
MDKKTAFILWFDQIGNEDVPLVGGKNASLGEMYRELTSKGVKVPNGFAITAYSYFYLLEKGGVKTKLKEIFKGLDTHNMKNLADRGKKARELIKNIELPSDLKNAIVSEYKKLCEFYKVRELDVAVRSSATAEDLPDASFAGQQETYLNIRGERALLEACRKCFASIFTNRAISYRTDKGFDHFSIGLSIGIQKMVRSDKACSGVMFSIDTESGFKDVVSINGAYGLGENVVQGAVNPDEFYVHKPTLMRGFKPLLSKKVGSKEKKMVYSNDKNKPTKNIPTTEKERQNFCISDEDVLQIAKWACIIEDHYTQKAGKFKPMDIEWAKDGITGELFIVQARPETVHSMKDMSVLRKYILKEKGKVLVTGNSVGEKIGQGNANIITDVKQIQKFKKGEVLISDITNPDWEPIMKIASAIVTNKGGRTCHAAIVSRELGIPCIVGTLDSTQKVKSGTPITVDCSEGSTGYVYEGLLKFEVQETNLTDMKRPRTKMMMNIGDPQIAFELSSLPSDGVGLAREEFIINSFIKIHPLALLHFNKVKDKKARDLITKLTHGYKNKPDFFVDKLAQGIAMLVAAFYPKDVIVRLSDFKSNEYANLIGGQSFEPKEENPMIGWRGASRYYSKAYKDAFALECEAIKKVRDEMGLTNLVVMVPFCRTVEEGKSVLKVMEEYGLKQGVNELRVIAMCEIPSNVIMAEEFLEIFDGFSIGSNDLTQLTLGLDRDSALVSHIYDERNLSVKRLVKQVIDVANKKGKYIGICGQAPSDFPEFAEFLVQCGIKSMSINPDTVIKTTLIVTEKEKQLGIK